MFLKNLIIESNNSVLREISFHKGLNLIIDETESKKIQESGNNIGKTTVLRLIDFCFGSDGTNIFKDTEFPEKTNTQIEKYLKENNVIISLILKRDLDDFSSEEIVIKRNFLNRKAKIQEIDGLSYNDRDFTNKLKILIFNSDNSKPTFRQIISKNIRYEKNRLNNTLKVLHNTTKFEEYEALYFFWLGINTDTQGRKSALQHEKSIEETILKKLKKENSKSEIEQALSVIERDIIELNILKKQFNINENYEEDLDSLNEVKSKLNKLSTELNRLSIRKEIILEAKTELEKEYSNIDAHKLKELYKISHSFIPDLQIKFEELQKFHNNMLKEKIDFIISELPSLNGQLLQLQRYMKLLRLEENNITEKIQKKGVIEELEMIISKLNQKFEQKGMYEEQLKQWENVIKRLESIEEELNIINEGIESFHKLLDHRISEFNKYFSTLSQKLYDEQFILSQDKKDRTYVLKISSIGGNLGTGKKKGQIAAFDFAYIQFCEENDLPCLHFILHDQLENIHDNQLTIISNLANEINCQYIVPVLKDKLPPEINPEEYKILSLSQDDKLFKLP